MTAVTYGKLKASLRRKGRSGVGASVSPNACPRTLPNAERYAVPLPKLTDDVATLAARVDEHLKKMGAVWN
jgi:hypothetical protein